MRAERKQLEQELRRRETAGEPTADLSALTEHLGNEDVQYRWVPVAERHVMDWCRWNDVAYVVDRRYFDLVEVESASEFAERDVSKFQLAADAGSGFPAIGFKMREDSAERFHEFTRRKIGRKMCLLLDGEVLMAPLISAPIGPHGIITGGSEGFTKREVDEIIVRLANGRLKVNIQIESIKAIE